MNHKHYFTLGIIFIVFLTVAGIWLAGRKRTEPARETTAGLSIKKSIVTPPPAVAPVKPTKTPLPTSTPQHHIAPPKTHITPASETSPAPLPTGRISTGTKEISMPKGDGVIAGIVFYLESGEPVTEATVQARLLSPGFAAGATTTTLTDAEGSFRFSGIFPGVFGVNAQKDELRSMSIPPVNLTTIPQKPDLELQLFSGYTISGRIFEPGGIQPVPKAHVAAKTNFRQENVATADCDDAGHYVISGIFGRRVFLFASHEGFIQEGDWGTGTPHRLDLPQDRAGVKNVDLVLARGIKVSGHVLSTGDDSPIRGAEVYFNSDYARFRRRQQNVSITDAEGYFSGYVKPQSRLVLRATHNDFAENSTNPITVADEPIEDIVIKLGKGGTARGVVVTPEDEPVEGANVRGQAAGPSVGRGSSYFARQKTTTDEKGEFVFEKVPAGEYLLTASAEDYAQSKRVRVKVTEGEETEEIKIVLRSSHFIEGNVIEEDGKPVSGANVWAAPARRRVERPIRGRAASAISDADGNFRLTGLVAGKYIVGAYMKGMQGARKTVEADTSGVQIVLKSRETVTLRGRVVDAETKEPVTHFTLRHQWERRRFIGDFNNPDGQFQIDNLRVGRRYRFYINAQGYVETLSQSVRIPAESEPPEVVFEIGKGGSVLGTVRLLGSKEPVQGALVTLLNRRGTSQLNPIERTTLTNNDGVFLFERLSPGKVQLKIAKAPMAELIVSADVRNGEITDRGDLFLKPPGNIKGIVLDRAGHPVAGKMVQISGKDPLERFQASARTAPDGTFAFSALPAGKYTLSVRSPGYKVRNVNLKPGETASIKFQPKPAR